MQGVRVFRCLLVLVAALALSGCLTPEREWTNSAILSALRRLAPDAATAEAMHARVIALRAQNLFIEDIGAMLSVAQTFEPIAGQIERVFTVVTGARGVAAHLASKNVLAAIPGILPEELNLLALGRARAGANLSPVLVKHQAHFSSARPIYRLRAKVVDKALPPLRRKAVIALAQVPIRRHTDLAVLMWRGE
ncbi:MAG: hypothetical protein FD175_2641 [Beijerinckiaceae bacterium]|nr:MAG: hypothetical protein FD175_2641 [Beijerinckiaceae bacterium]